MGNGWILCALNVFYTALHFGHWKPMNYLQFIRIKLGHKPLWRLSIMFNYVRGCEAIVDVITSKF
jgi:hypothetical protein